MNDEHWHREVRRHSERIRSAERGRRTVLAQTVFLGTLSILFLLPLIGGAYLGRWLDSQQPGYATHWTVNGILLGLVLGIFNVWCFIRRYG
ncbi:AtpZ/AtpI family protein [Methyloparacoccus murrellii]